MPPDTETALVSIPQPDGKRPIGGHSHLLDLDAPIQSMNSLAEELGPIYMLEFAGGAELIVISSQELTAEVCDETRFDKKVSGALFNIRDFAYDGLFTAHTRRRQLAARASTVGASLRHGRDARLLSANARGEPATLRPLGPAKP